MTVFILLREDQNQHGFVDTSIVGVYSNRHASERDMHRIAARERAAGVIVEDDDLHPDIDWQVSLCIDKQVVVERV